MPISIAVKIENINYWRDEIEDLRKAVKEKKFDGLDYKFELTEMLYNSSINCDPTLKAWVLKMQIKNIKNEKLREYSKTTWVNKFLDDLLEGHYNS